LQSSTPNTPLDNSDINILYQDDFLVAINKPHGLLVHRTPIAKDATRFALQEVRNMVGKNVYPIHRLDRKTSGILLFALSEQVHKEMQAEFAARKVDKIYWAIVRGYTDDSGTIDYPLCNESGKSQEAVTHYQTLDKAELPVPHGKHATSRYSLVEIKPITGRTHQIRKHFAHIFHPIIADRTHGCNKQNRFFTHQWNMNTMLLHARKIHFEHPVTKKTVSLTAEVQSEFQRMMDMMQFDTRKTTTGKSPDSTP
jgi:tRNA pseudouridine65 synthase